VPSTGPKTTKRGCYKGGTKRICLNEKEISSSIGNTEADLEVERREGDCERKDFRPRGGRDPTKENLVVQLTLSERVENKTVHGGRERSSQLFEQRAMVVTKLFTGRKNRCGQVGFNERKPGKRTNQYSEGKRIGGKVRNRHYTQPGRTAKDRVGFVWSLTKNRERGLSNGNRRTGANAIKTEPQ